MENPDKKSRWKIHMENLVAWTLDVNKATHLREAALRVERQELQPFPNELSTLIIQHINDSALYWLSTLMIQHINDSAR